MGILEDADLSDEEYGRLTLLFYVAFLICEMPHAYLMQRLPTAKYLGTMVCLWGTVVACTSACENYASLAALRFLLGMFESAISPSLILVTSMWYRRDEQPTRVGLWYIGVGMASIVGALISYGFQFYVGHAFKSWQIMFLIVGLITVIIGINVIIFMPDNPMSARRLTHPERVAAVKRLRENQTGVENKHFKPYQLWHLAKDPQTWLLAFITTAASIPNGAVGGFQSILISGFGYTDKESALLQMPGGAIAVASVLIATFTAARFNARGLNIIFWSAFGGLIGGSLLAFGKAQSTQLAGNYITHVVGAFLPCSYAFSAANTAGHTKKVSMNAILLMSFCLGNILGPLTFRNADAPSFIPGKYRCATLQTFILFCGYANCLPPLSYSENHNRSSRRCSHPSDNHTTAILQMAEQETRSRNGWNRAQA